MPRRNPRSRAAKKRMAELKSARHPRQPRDDVMARCGTGYRHPFKRWSTSHFTGRWHKLLIPAECPNKKLVLLIGDLHLQSLINGFVQMPEGELSFGFLSTSAAFLLTEVLNTSVPQTPAAVCLLAPNSSLTSKKTIKAAGTDFYLLLLAVCSRWSNVFVMDSPPCLNVEVSLQKLLSEEYDRVATQMGVKYVSVAESFPLDRLDLWCRDGVHLSDGPGMDVLVRLVWDAACRQLEAPQPPPASPRASAPGENSPVRMLMNQTLPRLRCRKAAQPPPVTKRVKRNNKQAQDKFRSSPGDQQEDSIDAFPFAVTLSDLDYDWQEPLSGSELEYS